MLKWLKWGGFALVRPGVTRSGASSSLRIFQTLVKRSLQMDEKPQSALKLGLNRSAGGDPYPEVIVILMNFMLGSIMRAWDAGCHVCCMSAMVAPEDQCMREGIELVRIGMGFTEIGRSVNA